MGDDLLREVAHYYSNKLAAHGATPAGVDWNGSESQSLRFAQLTKVIESSQSFSVNDLGCGYGALYDYLIERYPDCRYTGYDVSPEMVEVARTRLGIEAGVRFELGDRPIESADYGIASGIFNVRLGRSDEEWWDHLEGTLTTLNSATSKGFAFNCLTSYSDPERTRDDLYYADPMRVFDLCKRRYSRHVALLHDYGLYEFTVLVRKCNE